MRKNNVLARDPDRALTHTLKLLPTSSDFLGRASPRIRLPSRPAIFAQEDIYSIKIGFFLTLPSNHQQRQVPQHDQLLHDPSNANSIYGSGVTIRPFRFQRLVKRLSSHRSYFCISSWKNPKGSSWRLFWCRDRDNTVVIVAPE